MQFNLFYITDKLSTSSICQQKFSQPPIVCTSTIQCTSCFTFQLTALKQHERYQLNYSAAGTILISRHMCNMSLIHEKWLFPTEMAGCLLWHLNSLSHCPLIISILLLLTMIICIICVAVAAKLVQWFTHLNDVKLYILSF